MSIRFTHISMRVLAVITGLFAIASLYFQLFIVKNDPDAIYLWIITIAIFVLTYAFWKKYRWSVYLYVGGLLANNIKAAIDGTWTLSSQLLIAVVILTVLALNFKNLK
ncbi:MAG: hypothetical protein ABJ004_00275 [Cyclobacteriaceae bacterium]